MKNILVIGGAGYIGSHTVVELVNAGFEPIIIDNFSNSHRDMVAGIEELTKKKIKFYEKNYRYLGVLDKIFMENKIDGIIHFAALKSVGESVENPIEYYSNNVSGFIEILEAMVRHKINKIVLSSSAAVYGSTTGEVNEESNCMPSSPYGQTKLMDEFILRDSCNAQKLNGTALRYFNVVGAHPSGIIGEMPMGKPANLLPLLIQAVNKEIPPITVFGDDYNTEDGTCLRDYIHVVDLAKAHIAALNKLSGYNVYNIGTGVPTSVLGLIKAFEQINKVKVPYKIGQRRIGDPESSFANVEKARSELDWEANNTINESVKDAWRWNQYQKNRTI